MQARIFLFIFLVFSSSFAPSLFAEDGYIGEDLGNDIYKRLDEGTYKLKKQLIENRLEGSTKKINEQLGEVCSTKIIIPMKTGKKIKCFRDGLDFTTSELEEVGAGGLGPIYMHMDPEGSGIDTELAVRIRGIIMEYYQKIQQSVAYDQKKLQSVGSIGLFTDGNKDNSSYDLMVDLEDIHTVIFAKDIPYNGTENMGASSVANLLANVYDHPFLPLSPTDLLHPSPEKDPGVSIISPRA